MGRKSKKGSSRKPPRPAGGAAAPTNADWEDSSAAFRKEAESAIRAWSEGADVVEAAAARLAERHPASPLAHHILGRARASLARAGDAVPPLRRAAELAPRCPGIAATLATALLYARRPREALAECARALAVASPTDPALHAAAASACRRLMAPSPQARVAAARERLLGVRADAEALTATGAHQPTMPLPPMTAPTRTSCCCRHATTRGAVTDDELRGLLSVSFDDLKAHCDQTESVHLLAGAVEFAKATKAWAYWLCPVCDKVFLDANSFMSHVEGEYIHELQEVQPLMPKRAALDSEELHYSLRWWTPFEMGEEDAERRRNLDKIRDVFSCLNTIKALPLGLVDRVIKFARGRSKKPLPYCIPSCVTSLDSRELQRLAEPLDQLLKHMYRNWEFVRCLGDEGKSKGRSDVISLVQDGSILSLDAEKIASRNADVSCEVDVLFRWLLNSQEESVVSWASLRQNCVHHGNEVLKRIYETSDLLLRQFNLKCASKEKNHRGFLTEADSIDVEMLLLDNEVDCLKKKLVEVCTFDYSAAILPLIRAYIWAKLNSNSHEEDLHDGHDKVAVNNRDGSDVLHDQSVFDDKIPDTDSYMHYEISRTEECENSSLSLSDSSNLSTLETESASIDSGVGTVRHVTAEELQHLNVILRALWHLREFHDRFLNRAPVLPHFTVDAHCIVCLLRKVFNVWDNENDHGVATFPSDAATAFSDILNERNICSKACTNIASEIILTIFEALHWSHASLRSDSATLEHQLISTTRCLDFVCVPHNVFGLPIREQKKCNCLNESCGGNEYTTFFHYIDVSAIQTTEMKSLGQVLRDADKQFPCDTRSCQCGNKIARSLRSWPPIFATVFNWPIDKENRIDMSEVLRNITAPLQFDILYEVLGAEDYNLATAVCRVEEEHLCFSRQEEKWIIYGSKTVEFADSWESLLHRYRYRSLQPLILFFDHVR